MDRYKFKHLDQKLVDNLLGLNKDETLFSLLFILDKNLDILYLQKSYEYDTSDFLHHIKAGVFIDCFNLLNDIVSCTTPYLQEKDENQKWRQFFTKDDTNNMGNAINGLIKIINNLNYDFKDDIDEMKTMRDVIAHKTYLPSDRNKKKKRKVAIEKVNSISTEELLNNIKQNATHVFRMIIILSKDDFCPFCNKNHS